jgi:fructoselysine-6-P-deglycase FrlB-like protein
MDPVLFRADLERKPAVLQSLAVNLDARNPWADSGIEPTDRIILIGMGSSHYANCIAAARLQALGVGAVATLASSDLLPRVDTKDVVIVVSASGGSIETVAAARHYSGTCRTIALTNVESSEISALCDQHIVMHAEVEAGGVACRSYQHTLVLLLCLQELLVAGSMDSSVAALVRAAAEASADLLATEAEWLPDVSKLLLGPAGSAVVAPARRFSSAQQSALMLREGPRLAAVGCETGDWSHVDVYLTKTTDYRMLLLAGSRWEPALMDWCAQRGSTVVAAGGDVPGAAFTLRYLHDDVDDVRLLSETLIAELIAARAWGMASSA